MNLLVIDGQGGKIGRAIVEQLRAAGFADEIIAVGTNTTATAAMMKAGADAGATGENPVAVNAAKADVIAGPIGILAANSLLGEITPRMALAVSQSNAQKILIPMNRCHIFVAGTPELPFSETIALAVQAILQKEASHHGKND